MTNNKEELVDITVCKGLAIFLVVLGHIAGHTIPAGHEWYEGLRTYLYYFHMPFFMFLSGYVYFRPGRLEGLWRNYSSFFSKQLVKLMLPFFAFGIGILLLKFSIQHMVHVDNVPLSLSDGFYHMLWNTNDSPVLFIWYVFALFVFTVACPLLYPLLKERMDFYVIISLVVYCLPWVDVLYANKLVTYFFFFAFGGLLRHNTSAYFSTHHLGYVASFCVALYFATDIPKRAGILIVGSLSIPALHYIARTALNFRLTYMLGRESYIIYLLNTLCIGATKAIIFIYAGWDGLNFLWVAPLLLATGLIGPIVIKWWFIVMANKLLKRPMPRLPFYRPPSLG